MTDKTKSLTAWISIVFVIIGAIVSVVVYGVTIDNKTRINERDIVKVSELATSNEQRINVHDIKMDRIADIEADLKEIKKSNVEILLSLKRLETKMENEKE
jgi:ABC-type lipoprotein release transport system permease subunit